ncbi:unnamed protein product [Prorocentrum cordatum]|uniref:Uncharacterized protein n=1 Tax=Prorocentrum cordatum TaxID=2364126 RepID=A0ABN9YG55_9DINO|nr:unnamed protein product [Polarella glacialis]
MSPTHCRCNLGSSVAAQALSDFTTYLTPGTGMYRICCASPLALLTLTSSTAFILEPSRPFTLSTHPSDAGRFLECLRADNTEGKRADQRLNECLDSHQYGCENRPIHQVIAHKGGYASTLNTWVHSFVWVLQHGQVWLPSGPFRYNDPGLCDPEAGLDCYYEKVTNCTGTPIRVSKAKEFLPLSTGTFLDDVATSLGVSRNWVWGHIAQYALRMKPSTKDNMMAITPAFEARHTFGIQYRSFDLTGLMGNDERKSVGIDKYLEYADKLIKGASGIRTMYVMTDTNQLTVDYLKAARSQYEFLSPQRQVADLAIQQAGSIANMTYELLADMDAMVQAEVFIGSHSNIFWLIHALRETRENGPGMSCWVNIRSEAAPLLCPGDAEFWTDSPVGMAK